MLLPEVVAESHAIRDWIVAIRRRIHEHPELGFEEEQTSRLVCQTLTELGIPFQSGVAKTGVVATISNNTGFNNTGANSTGANSTGGCVGLRADMDALPIHEEADVPFRSRVDGKMHACGHDCHTAMLLGAARVLAKFRTQLRGTVKLFFQPAEEMLNGGERMCEAGVLSNPNVQQVFGLHVWPFLPTGTIGARAGTFLAAVGGFDIIVQGRGGHGAMPHVTRDPIATAAKVICELQTIVSRELDPFDPGVVSVTAVRGGEAYNVIPEKVHLKGTIRSLRMEGLHFLKRRITEMTTLIASASNCQAEVVFTPHELPPTCNDPASWETAKELGRDIFGADRVHELSPIMGGEDFAFYLQRVPGCFVGLGVGNEDIGAVYSVHHPKFKVDENALPLGTALHSAFALRTLNSLE